MKKEGVHLKASLWAPALLALVALTPSCDHVGGTTGPPPGWPNEPAGFTTLSDYGFDDPLIVGDGVVLSGGWSINNGAGNASQVHDPGAPMSPPNVGRWRYPIGFVGGDGPAAMYRDLDAPRDEMFFGYRWKASTPWQGHPTGVNEISFVVAQDNILVVQMNGPPEGPFDLIVTTEFTTSNGHLANSWGDDPGPRHLSGNVRGGNYVVTPGRWYDIEVYYKMSTTSTSRDGILQWWVNGTPVGDYNTVNFDPTQPFEQFQFNPTWGGAGSSKTEEDYFWYDHVRLSVP
jgi:hypothetical protein